MGRARSRVDDDWPVCAKSAVGTTHSSSKTCGQPRAREPAPSCSVSTRCTDPSGCTADCRSSTCPAKIMGRGERRGKACMRLVSAAVCAPVCKMMYRTPLHTLPSLAAPLSPPKAGGGQSRAQACSDPPWPRPRPSRRMRMRPRRRRAPRGRHARTAGRSPGCHRRGPSWSSPTAAARRTAARARTAGGSWPRSRPAGTPRTKPRCGARGGSADRTGPTGARSRALSRPAPRTSPACRPRGASRQTVGTVARPGRRASGRAGPRRSGSGMLGSSPCPLLCRWSTVGEICNGRRSEAGTRTLGSPGTTSPATADQVRGSRAARSDKGGLGLGPHRDFGQISVGPLWKSPSFESKNILNPCFLKTSFFCNLDLRTVSGIYVRIDTSHHIPTVRPLPACLRRIAQAPHAVQGELKT